MLIRRGARDGDERIIVRYQEFEDQFLMEGFVTILFAKPSPFDTRMSLISPQS